MHAIVDDVRGDEKGDAGDERAEHILPGGDGYPSVRGKAGEPANQQLDKWNKDSPEKLEQPVIKQEGGVLLRENPAPVYVGKYTAQKPEGKYNGNGMNGIHERKADPDGRFNLAAAVRPYVNIISRMDRHVTGKRVLTALRSDCLYNMFIRMEREGLAAHQAEDCTQGDEGNDKIAGSFQEPGSGSRESLVCELLKEFSFRSPRVYDNTSVLIRQ